MFSYILGFPKLCPSVGGANPNLARLGRVKSPSPSIAEQVLNSIFYFTRCHILEELPDELHQYLGNATPIY